MYCKACRLKHKNMLKIFCYTLSEISLGIIQHFHKSTESMLEGGGKSGCILLKMLVLNTVPIYETSLANHHFCSTLLYRGRDM